MSSGPSVISARLIMLPFALLTWLVAWSLRFLRTPIKNPLVKLGVLLALGVAFFGGALGQMAAYRSLSGIRVLQDDHLFMGSLALEYVIGGIIIIFGELKRDRKNRSR